MEKEILSVISGFFPGETKLYSLDQIQNVELLLRMIGSQKQKKIFFRDERPNMIAEKTVFEKKEVLVHNNEFFHDWTQRETRPSP